MINELFRKTRTLAYSVEPGWELNPHIAALQAYNIGFNINNSASVKIRNIEKTVSDFVVYLSIDERLNTQHN